MTIKNFTYNICNNEDYTEFQSISKEYLKIFKNDVETVTLEKIYKNILKTQEISSASSDNKSTLEFAHNYEYNLYNPETFHNYINNNYYVDIKLSNIDDTMIQIPYISHRFWIFNKKITLPNYTQISISSNSISKIDEISKKPWIHFLWTNKVNILQDFLIENKYYSLLHTTLIVSPDYVTNYDFTTTCKKGEYIGSMAVCADLLKHTILEKYGGIYIDIDYKIEQYYIELNHIFQFYIPTSEDGWLGNAAMASSSQHKYHKYSKEIALDLILSTEQLYNQSYIEKTMYFSRQDIVYTKYYYTTKTTELTKDGHIPFESIYRTLTTKECNINLIGKDNTNINLCIIGSDLQMGSWYNKQEKIMKDQLHDCQNKLTTIYQELQYMPEIDKFIEYINFLHDDLNE